MSTLPDLASAVDHVIVCGLADVGLRVIEQLHAAGERVVILDDEPDPRLLRVTESWQIPHLNASAQREPALVAAGLAGAAALVCVAEDDLRNLEIALLARRLQPELRVVLHLTNPAVGRAVARVIGPHSVLDVASLAAPAFVQACLDKREHTLTMAGTEFVVTELIAETTAALRVNFGDLAPIAVLPAGGGPPTVCPGRDLLVHAGDRVTVMGTEADFVDRRHISPAEPTGPARRGGRRRLRVAWHYVAGFARETERSLRLTLATLVGVAALSVVLLMLGYATIGGRRMSVLDALYFTTETLTTVGFGDFTFATQPSWLRVWAIALMVLGATLVTIVYALLTNLLVSRRIEESLGRQQVTGMSGHVILVGLGAVGVRVMEQLVAAGQPVVVLERDADNRYLSNARTLEVPVIIGDSTIGRNLSAANLDSARAVAVLTSNDLANIETGLAVDDLLGDRRSEVPVVLRVFDRQLGHTLEDSFGFANVRSTSALAAPWFVGAALGFEVLDTFYVGAQPFLLARLSIAESGGLHGRTMLELSARTRVVALSRGGDGALEHPPRRDTRFTAGDQAYLVGPYEELLQVLRTDQRAAAGSDVESV